MDNRIEDTAEDDQTFNEEVSTKDARVKKRKKIRKQTECLNSEQETTETGLITEKEEERECIRKEKRRKASFDQGKKREKIGTEKIRKQNEEEKQKWRRRYKKERKSKKSVRETVLRTKKRY